MFDVPAGLPTDLWSIPYPLHRYQTIEVPESRQKPESFSRFLMGFLDILYASNGLPVLWCITYHALGTLVVLGVVSGGLPRPQTKSPSVPDDPKKHFEKFEKTEKS